MEVCPVSSMGGARAVPDQSTSCFPSPPRNETAPRRDLRRPAATLASAAPLASQPLLILDEPGRHQASVIRKIGALVTASAQRMAILLRSGGSTSPPLAK